MLQRPRLLTGDETACQGGVMLPTLVRFEGLQHRWTWRYIARRVPLPGEWFLPDALSVARMAVEDAMYFSPEIIVKPDIAYEEVVAFRPKAVQPSRIP